MELIYSSARDNQKSRQIFETVFQDIGHQAINSTEDKQGERYDVSEFPGHDARRRSLGRAWQSLRVEEMELRVCRDQSVSVPRAEDQRRKLWMPAKCGFIQACEDNCLRPVKELSGRVRRISAQHSNWARKSAWHSHGAGNSACLHLPVWKTSYFKRNWMEHSERSCPSGGIVELGYMLPWSCLVILEINIQEDLF